MTQRIKPKCKPIKLFILHCEIKTQTLITKMIYSKQCYLLTVVILLVSILALASQTQAQAKPFSPKVAIVLCTDTYHHQSLWTLSQMSSQALVGLAGLAGVPFDTITLDTLLTQSNTDYTSLWFSACSIVNSKNIDPLLDTLQRHLDAGGSLLLDGPLAKLSFSDDTNALRVNTRTESITNIADNGYRNIEGYSIVTTDTPHPILNHAGLNLGQSLTQKLTSGNELVRLHNTDIPGAAILLELTSPEGGNNYPFLVVSEPANARIVGLSSYSSFAGAAAIFRNAESAEFFNNQLNPFIMEVLFWLLAPQDEPFATLQLSHADMTTIVRLDADHSNVATSVEKSFNYLIQLGKETGVTTVYGIVSEFTEAINGWQDIQASAQHIEALGGMIASHSHTHPSNMSVQLDSHHWQTQVHESLKTIRNQLTNKNFQPNVRAFINPGNTVHWQDYQKFSDDIDIFLTHGFESSQLYASGVMSFSLPESNSPPLVLNSTLVPDNRWLYDPNWQYTVQQAADFQKQIINYYQHTIQRGVLYSEMYHDYMIANLAPLHYPESESTEAFLDVNKNHYLQEKIYAPSVTELTGKFHTARFALYTSNYNPDSSQLNVSLDLSQVPEQHRRHLSGMGLRVNHIQGEIRSVIIDGKNHAAFNAHTVILPPEQNTVMHITITLGETSDQTPRLTYLSKPFSAIEKTDAELTAKLNNPGLMTKFCLKAQADSIVFNADQYQVTASQDFCGHLKFANPSGEIRIAPWQNSFGLRLTDSQRPIVAAYHDDGSANLCLAPGNAASEVLFNSASAVPSIFINGQQKTASSNGNNHDFSVQLDTEKAVLLSFSQEDNDHCFGDHTQLSEAAKAFCSRCLTTIELLNQLAPPIDHEPVAVTSQNDDKKYIGIGALNWLFSLLIMLSGLYSRNVVV